MATMCPKCGKGTIKKNDNTVYCSEYKPEKSGNDWVNKGTCEFRTSFSQKIFGKTLKIEEMKDLISGKILVNGQKKLKLDLANEKYFTENLKDEDEDL